MNGTHGPERVFDEHTEIVICSHLAHTISARYVAEAYPVASSRARAYRLATGGCSKKRGTRVRVPAAHTGEW
jgi:hypothetical protein